MFSTRSAVLAASLAALSSPALAQSRPATPLSPPSAPVAPAGGSFCGVARPSITAGSYPPDVVERVGAAGSVVAGTVVRLRATTQPFGDSLADAFVVRIDDAPVWQYGGGWTGREISYLAGPAGLPALGARAWFFGVTQTAGESLLLRETYRLDAATHPGFAAALPGIRAFLDDRALYDRAARARLVALGTVRAVRNVGPPASSEHAAVWAEATVDVERVACGATPRAVTVRFDRSIDVAHYREPKLAVGQRAVFLLDDDTLSGLGGAAYVVTEPLQVQPDREWTRVARLGSTPRVLALPVEPSAAPPAPVAPHTLAVAPPAAPSQPVGAPLSSYRVFRSRAELGALASVVPDGFPFARESLVLVGLAAGATCCAATRPQQGAPEVRILEQDSSPADDGCEHAVTEAGARWCSAQQQALTVARTVRGGVLARVPRSFRGRLYLMARPPEPRVRPVQ